MSHLRIALALLLGASATSAALAHHDPEQQTVVQNGTLIPAKNVSPEWFAKAKAEYPSGRRRGRLAPWQNLSARVWCSMESMIIELSNSNSIQRDIPLERAREVQRNWSLESRSNGTVTAVHINAPQLIRAPRQSPEKCKVLPEIPSARS